MEKRKSPTCISFLFVCITGTIYRTSIQCIDIFSSLASSWTLLTIFRLTRITHVSTTDYASFILYYEAEKEKELLIYFRWWMYVLCMPNWPLNNSPLQPKKSQSVYLNIHFLRGSKLRKHGFGKTCYSFIVDRINTGRYVRYRAQE